MAIYSFLERLSQLTARFPCPSEPDSPANCGVGGRGSAFSDRSASPAPQQLADLPEQNSSSNLDDGSSDFGSKQVNRKNHFNGNKLLSVLRLGEWKNDLLQQFHAASVLQFSQAMSVLHEKDQVFLLQMLFFSFFSCCSFDNYYLFIYAHLLPCFTYHCQCAFSILSLQSHFIFSSACASSHCNCSAVCSRFLADGVSRHFQCAWCRR
jgi:hypothetical protein